MIRLMQSLSKNNDKNFIYIFFVYKNMSLSDLIKRANQQQTAIEIKVEPKKQEALVDVEQKIEKIDPPTKKVGKTV